MTITRSDHGRTIRCRFVASLHPALGQAMGYQSLKILEMSEPC